MVTAYDFPSFLQGTILERKREKERYCVVLVSESERGAKQGQGLMRPTQPALMSSRNAFTGQLSFSLSPSHTLTHSLTGCIILFLLISQS